MTLKISVVVPVYNVEDYLVRAISSIINQTYENIEIILVDDGSKDNSYAIMKEYEVLDHRIKCVQKENGGLSSARNSGLKETTGDYVYFVDSDDYIELNTIECMVEAVCEHGADLVVCDMAYLYDDGTKNIASGGSFDISCFEDNPDLFYINNSACNKLIHKKLLDGFKFPEGLWYEDLASIPLLVARAKKVVKLNEAFYVYYQRSGSIAHSATKKIFDIYEAISMLEAEVSKDIKKMYIVHGLDLTTLRIKDFDDKGIREAYLKENMTKLRAYYPRWSKDAYLKQYSLKKRIMFKLLELGQYHLVLKLFDH